MTTRAAIQAVVDGPLVIDEVRLSVPGPDQVASWASIIEYAPQ